MVLTKTSAYLIFLLHDQWHAAFTLSLALASVCPSHTSGARVSFLEPTPACSLIQVQSHSFVYPYIVAPPLYWALGTQDDSIQVSALSELESNEAENSDNC